jgi:hypothetical protein
VERDKPKKIGIGWTNFAVSIRKIIIYLESKFHPNRRIFVFGGHFVPWLPWQRSPFWIFFNPPKAATYYGGYSYKVDHFDVRNLYPWFGSHIMIHFVGISTVVCGSFWGVEKIQNGGRCHGTPQRIQIPWHRFMNLRSTPAIWVHGTGVGTKNVSADKKSTNRVSISKRSFLRHINFFQWNDFIQ